jgi:hypothetical protein
MKNSLMILPLLAIALLTACEKADYDLEKSVYVPDPEYSGLPAYSEWGYNTFGAFYERKIFIYNDNEVPAKVIHTKGITRFILKGGLVPADYNDYYYGNDYVNTTMSLSFELPGFAPGNYADLVQLNDTAFDLSDPNLTVFAVLGNDTIQMDIFNGELIFEKARQLIVDDTPLKVILSGYFGFQALVNGEPVSMSYGRFDVGIDEYDFADY